jgi:hypothetical protein
VIPLVSHVLTNAEELPVEIVEMEEQNFSAHGMNSMSLEVIEDHRKNYTTQQSFELRKH